MASIEQLLPASETPKRESVARQKAKAEDSKTVVCPSCGAENPGRHRFCGQCGAALGG
ncbi:MAG: zinc-ribbon domain-containing protein [Acidobacteria bacterium]|nr:zinc-ribbon domain-containing protein [Acidobacteriota bacterium]